MSTDILIVTLEPQLQAMKSFWLVLLLLLKVCLAQNDQIPPVQISEDATLLVPQLVEKYGYPCETHVVTTADGYILTLHRIPHGRTSSNKPGYPVFLQHGLISSSADWLLAGPKRSLGYILADAGYDVWISNCRGNRYSRNHTRLNSNDLEFWNFSFHELGYYDLPAMVDYVLRETNRTSLNFIGHSQGTTVFYVMCSERPEYNEKINLHVSLAPTAYMNHVSSPIVRSLGLSVPERLNMRMEMLSRVSAAPMLGQLLCSPGSNFHATCINVISSIFGSNLKQLNQTLLPTVIGHTPAGCSMNQLLHYAQLIKTGTFRRWDAGRFGNLLLYQNMTPPEYPVEKITAPIHIYYSNNDFMSNEVDVLRLEKRLPNVKQKTLISDSNFNHMDYLYAMNAPRQLYRRILKSFNKFEP